MKIAFSRVERRGGRWGWFVHRDRCQPEFVAYGNVQTKREAADRRRADITAAGKAAIDLENAQ